MNKVLDVLAVIAIAIGAVLTVALSFVIAVGCLVMGAILRALPWIVIILVIAWVVTGCVYQPVHIEAYIPTTAVVGGDVLLDTVGNKLTEVAK